MMLQSQRSHSQGLELRTPELESTGSVHGSSQCSSDKHDLMMCTVDVSDASSSRSHTPHDHSNPAMHGDEAIQRLHPAGHSVQNWPAMENSHGLVHQELNKAEQQLHDCMTLYAAATQHLAGLTVSRSFSCDDRVLIMIT